MHKQFRRKFLHTQSHPSLPAHLLCKPVSQCNGSRCNKRSSPTLPPLTTQGMKLDQMAHLSSHHPPFVVALPSKCKRTQNQCSFRDRVSLKAYSIRAVMLETTGNCIIAHAKANIKENKNAYNSFWRYVLLLFKSCSHPGRKFDSKAKCIGQPPHSKGISGLTNLLMSNENVYEC